MKPKHLLCSLFLQSSLATILHAGLPISGVSVAVSADGSQLLAGGNTRTILHLDPESLEVKERRWLGYSIVDIVFNGDGSIVAVYDTSDTVHLYKTADWSEIAKIPKVKMFCAAPGADVFAGYGGGFNEVIVEVYSFSDGAKKAGIPLAKGQKITSLGLNPEGTKVAVLCAATDDPSETKAQRSAMPKELKGAEQKDWLLRNDGKTSSFLILDVAGSSIASETKTYFSGNRGSISYTGEKLTYISPVNANATISPAGDFTVFELQNMNNAGVGFTRNQSHIITGGVERFTITQVKDMESVAGKTDTLGSFQESFITFTGTDDGGAIYGSTNAYRIFKLDAKGTVIKAAPGI